MYKSRGWLALFGTHTAWGFFLFLSFLNFLFVASTPIPLCLSPLSLSNFQLCQKSEGNTSLRQVFENI